MSSKGASEEEVDLRPAQEQGFLLRLAGNVACNRVRMTFLLFKATTGILISLHPCIQNKGKGENQFYMENWKTASTLSQNGERKPRGTSSRAIVGLSL